MESFWLFTQLNTGVTVNCAVVCCIEKLRSSSKALKQDLTLRQHPSLVSPLGKSVHLWITLWPSLLLLLWSLPDLIMLIALFGCPQKHAARLQCVQQPLATVVMQQSSVSPLTSTELLKQLHWLGSPSNGESDVSLLV